MIFFQKKMIVIITFVQKGGTSTHLAFHSIRFDSTIVILHSICKIKSFFKNSKEKNYSIWKVYLITRVLL